MIISLNINDDAAADYARFKGYQATVNGTENPQSVEDCVAQSLFAVVQNDLIEQRNRDAITEAASQPAPIVSPDQVTDDTIEDTATVEEMENEDATE